jgi:hypothetical protein
MICADYGRRFAKVKVLKRYLPVLSHIVRGYFDYKWVDYDNLSCASLKLAPPNQRLSEWRADYQAMQSMFFNTPPDFDEIIETLRKIEDDLLR